MLNVLLNVLLLLIISMMPGYGIFRSKLCFRPIHSRGVTAINGQSSSTPYTFYEAMGNPKFISAPMVDQSSMIWRIFVRKHGADLAFSQMMYARNFMNDAKYRRDCIDWDNYTHISGDHRLEAEAKSLDSPLIGQLAGHDPDVIVQAGLHIHRDVQAIDLNLGCPQKIAKRGFYGAYLLPNEDLVCSILTAMVANYDCPVTAKVRIQSNDADTLRLCKAFESCGISMLTVHGRTVTSSKLFTGPADWDIIGKIKTSLSIPVIANGGIGNRDDAINCLQHTGADGIMSSEALLENPKLFSEEGDYLFRNDYARAQLNTVKEFMDMIRSYPPPRPLYQCVRGHLFKMMHRFVNAPKNKDLQQRLACGDLDEMENIIAELDHRIQKHANYDVDKAEDCGLISATSYYMRHRDVRSQQRIVNLPKWKRNNIDSQHKHDGEVEDLKTKLQKLKKRLKEKRQNNMTLSSKII